MNQTACVLKKIGIFNLHVTLFDEEFLLLVALKIKQYCHLKHGITQSNTNQLRSLRNSLNACRLVRMNADQIILIFLHDEYRRIWINTNTSLHDEYSYIDKQ